jgi:hypothetical protein
MSEFPLTNEFRGIDPPEGSVHNTLTLNQLSSLCLKHLEDLELFLNKIRREKEIVTKNLRYEEAAALRDIEKPVVEKLKTFFKITVEV